MFKKIKRVFSQYSVKKIVRIFDSKYGLGFLENLIASNWFNPFLTLYLNFRSFPLKYAWKLPIFVYGRPRFYNLSGEMIIVGDVTSGMIIFNNCSYGAPSIMSVQSELSNLGVIKFKGKGRIGTGCKIHVGYNSILEIGSYFKIQDMCNIGCYSKILIGDKTWITHRCQVFDSNYHYVANFKKGIIPSWRKEIIIGESCWICNSTTVAGGTILPNFTIVSSNSLVNKDFSTIAESSLIGGIPAKYITSGLRRVENIKLERLIARHYSVCSDNYIIRNETMEECSTIK